MSSREEKLRQRAVKAGIRAARRRRHVPGEEELRALKVQVLPAWPRFIMGTSGTSMMVAALCGFPASSNATQGLTFFGGLFLLLFGLFGVRRTLSDIVDHLSTEAAGEFLVSVIESIGDAVDF